MFRFHLLDTGMRLLSIFVQDNYSGQPKSAISLSTEDKPADND
jgi:hypothetical protein